MMANMNYIQLVVMVMIKKSFRAMRILNADLI